jgi:putative hydroxymethylpyrimidine transport system substrate-binding protein
MRARIACWLLALLSATVLLVGCGGGESEGEATDSSLERFRSIKVVLDGEAPVTSVGILMAQKRGYFYDFDLGVEEVSAPVYPGRPVQYVVNGSVGLGISHQPQVSLSRSKGAPIVSVGTLVPQPTAAMIWLKKSGIRSVADLKGKTIAIPGIPFQKQLLEEVLARAGLTLAEVKVEFAGFDLLPALVSGRADAIFGGTWNIEGIELEARGLEPVITRVQNLGVPPYDELVVIGRRDQIAKDPELAHDFMSAVAHGTEAAIKDPEAAIEVLADERNLFQAPPVSKKVLKAELEATLPLLSRSIAASS